MTTSHHWEWHLRGWQIMLTVDLYSFMFGFAVGPRDIVVHCAFATIVVIDWNIE